MSPRKPAWQQALVSTTLVTLASFVGLGAVSSGLRSSASVGTWAIVLAAPFTLVLAVLAWNGGRRQRWMFPLLGVVVYCGAGLLAGGFRFERWPPAIPILMLKPLLYPVAGLVWGALLQQLQEQGYLAFLGLERPE